jgi:hypothetical protein
LPSKEPTFFAGAIYVAWEIAFAVRVLATKLSPEYLRLKNIFVVKWLLFLPGAT